jgi:large subunit ribosomal protein L15
MVRQHELSAPAGAHKHRKRVGRGDGSGRGSYSGRGRKGAGARSGASRKAVRGFEGNQYAMIRKLPTLGGFNNPFAVRYQVVNIAQLQEHTRSGQKVTPAWLAGHGLITDAAQPVKVLGDGDITHKLTVQAHRFSASARQKLEAAGATLEEITPTGKKA